MTADIRPAVDSAFSENRTELVFCAFFEQGGMGPLRNYVLSAAWRQCMSYNDEATATSILALPVTVTPDHLFTRMLGDRALPSQRDAHVATSLITWFASSEGDVFWTRMAESVAKFNGDSLSQAYDDAWARLGNRPLATNDGSAAYTPMQYVMAQHARPMADDPVATERDRLVMARVMGWLGSAEGRSMLRSATAAMMPHKRALDFPWEKGRSLVL